MIEFLSQPWPWYIAGPLIAVIMLILLLSGERFGISTSFKTMCSIGGLGRFIPFFGDDWKQQSWNLVFILGAIIGGFISSTYLENPDPVAISEATIRDLTALGVGIKGNEILPTQLFSWEMLATAKGLIIMVLGGFLIGFGTRYGGGCTSGHAISGLSNLQLPSLIAVIGFFVGGLLMTHVLLPLILNL